MIALSAFAAGCSAEVGDASVDSGDAALSATAARDLVSHVRQNEAKILAAAKPNARGAKAADLDGRTVRCLGTGRGASLRGACLVKGNYAGAAGATATFSVVVHQTGANAAYTVLPVTADGVQPRGGHSSGSLQTYLVDGGGEDSVIDQLEGQGLPIDTVLGAGDDLGCVEDASPASLGVCLVNVKLTNGKRARVAVTVGEVNRGEALVVTSTQVEAAGPATGDAAVIAELAKSLDGLATGGGEGDPDPYKVLAVDLAAGEKLEGKTLLTRLLPKLEGFDGMADDLVPGFDTDDIAEFWSDATATPARADFDTDEDFDAAKLDAKKWKNVKAVVDAKLTNVQAFHLGYRSSPTSSLETGPVAVTLVGQLPSGKVVAIYGIVIWT
ncbi:MAG: hypothetical protein U0169_19735 [Polyangiaceae bacterium]